MQLVIERILDAWRVLLDKITCMKYDSCTELPVRPVEEIHWIALKYLLSTRFPEEDVRIEDISGLSIDPEHSDKDEDNIVD